MNASKIEESTWQGPSPEALDLENPMLGYLVVAAALLAGMLSASVFGQSPTQQSLPLQPTNRQSADDVSTVIEIQGVKLSHSSPQPNSEEPRTICGQHPLSPNVRKWVLGVRARATGVGCLVTEVVAGSAAASVPLAIGDRILAIDGKQVGWIGPRCVSLYKLIDQSPTRATRILVQKRVTGRLSLLSVQLKTPHQTLGFE